MCTLYYTDIVLKFKHKTVGSDKPTVQVVAFMCSISTDWQNWDGVLVSWLGADWRM